MPPGLGGYTVRRFEVFVQKNNLTGRIGIVYYCNNKVACSVTIECCIVVLETVHLYTSCVFEKVFFQQTSPRSKQHLLEQQRGRVGDGDNN